MSVICRDTYGYSVALSGDGSIALVGAYSGGGTEDGASTPTLQGGRYVLNGQITAPDGAPGDEFGMSVSPDGLALAPTAVAARAVELNMLSLRASGGTVRG
jgi:hypothetical protein